MTCRWRWKTFRQLIVDQAVTQETNHKRQLLPTITVIPTAIGRHAHIDFYISTRKQTRGERPDPVRAACQRAPRSIDRMSQVAHPAGGLARSSLPVVSSNSCCRGFEKVQGECSLVCTTHNILKLFASSGER